MKSVLASFKPKYCELIASGRKALELRKSCPKIDVPFKVYMYQTKGRWIYKILEWLGLYQGKVIGEFVCDRIDDFLVYNDGAVQNWNYIKLSKSCLKYAEIAEYIGTSKFGYAWHISDLVIYDKPKELSEFYRKCEKMPCEGCEHLKYVNSAEYDYECEYMEHKIPITRPPQSWCYVEELEQSSGEQ